MTLVVGVDPSSRKLAFVTTDCDGGSLTVFTHALKAQDITVRCTEAHRITVEWVTELFDCADDDIHVFVEEPVLGRGGARSTIVQSKVHGAVVAAFGVSGVCTSVKVVNNQHWKKKVVGKGNASKDDVRAWAAQYWGQLHTAARNGKDQDLIDAGAINRYGVGVVGMMERLRRHRARERRSLTRKRKR